MRWTKATPPFNEKRRRIVFSFFKSCIQIQSLESSYYTQLSNCNVCVFVKYLKRVATLWHHIPAVCQSPTRLGLLKEPQTNYELLTGDYYHQPDISSSAHSLTHFNNPSLHNHTFNISICRSVCCSNGTKQSKCFKSFLSVCALVREKWPCLQNILQLNTHATPTSIP